MGTSDQGQFDICVIGGCGHAGLPLGLSFADRGQRVVLYDIDRAAVELVNRKTMPFLEENAPAILEKVVDQGRLVATTDISVVSRASVLILVIGTPVDDHLNPRLDDVMSVIRAMSEYLRDGQLLILRSTVFPGVTQKIAEYLRQNKKTVSVAFCPERIAEGYAIRELSTLPQIVSGQDRESADRATRLFSLLTADIIELSPIEAELAKLFTNTWRYVNFAVANQFYMIANNYGLDFYRSYEAMTKGYPRLQGFARAGFAAGPCLFKDTMQLASFSNNNFFMGHAAMLVNEGMPNYVVEHIKRRMTLHDKCVGILGMAFKANIDDPRESLSYKCKKILELEAKEVVCADVYIPSPDFVTADELVRRADLIILATPHREYKALDFKGKPVVDIWNFLGLGGRTP